MKAYCRLTHPTAEVIDVEKIERVIDDDPDDDEVLAGAIAVQASYITSGDNHLLDLIAYQHIQILNASQFIVKYD